MQLPQKRPPRLRVKLNSGVAHVFIKLGMVSHGVAVNGVIDVTHTILRVEACKQTRTCNCGIHFMVIVQAVARLNQETIMIMMLRAVLPNCTPQLQVPLE